MHTHSYARVGSHVRIMVCIMNRSRVYSRTYVHTEEAGPQARQRRARTTSCSSRSLVKVPRRWDDCSCTAPLHTRAVWRGLAIRFLVRLPRRGTARHGGTVSSPNLMTASKCPQYYPGRRPRGFSSLDTAERSRRTYSLRPFLSL